MPRLTNLSVAVALFLSATGSSVAATWISPPAETPVAATTSRSAELEGVQKLRGLGESHKNSKKEGEADVAAGNLRFATQKSEARTYAARKALRWRYDQINKTVLAQEASLDIIYNFSPLLMEGMVLPPVLSRFENGFKIGSRTEARSVNVAYRIESQARLVSTPPNWRDFLVQEFEDPEPPYDAILPVDDDESAVWSKAAEEGWKAGVSQADDIFSGNVALLTRTVVGVLMYRELLIQKAIRPPVLTKTEAGIQVSNNSLDVGDVVYRLTADSAFEVQVNAWEPKPQDSTEFRLH